MLRMIRLPLAGLIFAALIAGCSSTPSQLSELPAATDAPLEDILRRADRRSGAEANLLRLHAAQTAWGRNQPEQVRSILGMIPQSELPLDQQQRFSELQARSELALGQPDAALRALRHPSLQQLDGLDPHKELDIQLLRAETMAATGDYLGSAQERMFIHNLLPESDRQQNLNAIWEALSQSPTDQLRQASSAASGETAGWLALALIPGKPATWTCRYIPCSNGATSTRIIPPSARPPKPSAACWNCTHSVRNTSRCCYRSRAISPERPTHCVTASWQPSTAP